MDLETSKYSWVILALTHSQFALDSPCHGPGKDTGGRARCWSLRPLQGFKRSQPQPAQIAAFVLPFLSRKIGWAAGNLTTSDLR